MATSSLKAEEELDNDAQRRADLRAFLIEHRSRLMPADVGLPRTSNRRVAGLRREEVAELAGVSNDWYRWFESGRPIRVSTLFLTRLSEALRLDGAERSDLYRLALPDLYQVDSKRLDNAQVLQLATLLRRDATIDAVVRDTQSARTAFLNGEDGALAKIRPRIRRSWQRSVALGADPSRINVPSAFKDECALTERRHAKYALVHAAQPVLSRLSPLLKSSRYALVLADETACVLEVAGDADMLQTMSKINLRPGGDLRECAWGTNAIGTSIFDERALQIIAAEHFCAGGANFACTAAPIRDPATHQITGAIDITCHVRMVRAEIVSIVHQAALEIEEQLYAYTGS